MNNSATIEIKYRWLLYSCFYKVLAGLSTLVWPVFLLKLALFFLLF
jgi:hypothetical protein